MSFNWEEHDAEIEKYLDTDRHCPKCGTECETDSSASNERDSSNDRHYCPKCDWSCNEMALWLIEDKRRKEKYE